MVTSEQKVYDILKIVWTYIYYVMWVSYNKIWLMLYTFNPFLFKIHKILCRMKNILNFVYNLENTQNYCEEV
jgi:hypothetical protein